MSNEITVKGSIEVKRYEFNYQMKVTLFEDGQSILSIDGTGFSNNFHLNIDELKALSTVIRANITNHEKAIHKKVMSEIHSSITEEN